MENNLSQIRLKRNTRRLLDHRGLSVSNLSKCLFPDRQLRKDSEIRNARRLINYKGRRRVSVDEFVTIAKFFQIPLEDLILGYTEFDQKYINQES